jgi:stalled ribosome rescue protein Dom34
MKTTKKLGIWMDHSTAHMMELTNDRIGTNTIQSKPKPLEDKQVPYKDESHQLNKEQRQLSAYYKKLSDEIKEFDEVLLFGPTEAKEELYNLLKEDHLFDNIKIGLRTVDKMSEKQQHAFVKGYFSAPEQKQSNLQNMSFFFF